MTAPLTTILARLAGSDLNDWSLPAVASALGRPVERTGSGRYVTAQPENGPAIEVVADPDVDDPKAPGAVYGLGLTATGHELAEVLARAGEVLGTPPTVGGPGPWARWPGARVWWTLARSPGTGTLRMFAEPAGRAADDERRDFELGGVRSVPYLWRLDDPAVLSPGSWLPVAPSVAGVRGVLAQLEPVCAAFSVATDRLPGVVPGAGVEIVGRHGRSVRCWFEPGRATVDVDGAQAEHPGGEVGARAVAHALEQAIASWDVSKPARHLSHRPLAPTGRTLTVPGLGLALARR